MRATNYAFSTATALTTATPTTVPCRGVLISCTAAGTLTLTLMDGSTVTIDVIVGTIVLPLAVTEYTAGTATATVYAMM